MTNILLIETSQTICSVALASDGKIIADYITHELMKHATCLPVYVNDALTVAREHNIRLDAIAVSGGPGSYTGLRIGVSTAKGLAYALQIPLIAIDTLEIMAREIIAATSPSTDTLICPMVDARRMEVYTTLFDCNFQNILPAEAKIIDAESYSDVDTSKSIIFGGNGADKCQGVITRTNCQWIKDITPTATEMVDIAYRMYNTKHFADVAYYEPFYLKEFQATTPKQQL